ncbi:unnamed protein product [Lota lota]
MTPSYFSKEEEEEEEEEEGQGAGAGAGQGARWHQQCRPPTITRNGTLKVGSGLTHPCGEAVPAVTRGYG